MLYPQCRVRPGPAVGAEDARPDRELCSKGTSAAGKSVELPDHPPVSMLVRLASSVRPASFAFSLRAFHSSTLLSLARGCATH